MGKMHKNYKWEVLALLWMAYLLNQADRQVFNTVLPAIIQSLISVINNILGYLYNQLCFSHKRLRKDTIILPKSRTS